MAVPGVTGGVAVRRVVGRNITGHGGADCHSDSYGFEHEQ